MLYNDELIHEFRKVTGWDVAKIQEEVSPLKCNYWIALDVYTASGRLPTDIEQRILNEYGFNAWYASFSRKSVKN